MIFTKFTIFASITILAVIFQGCVETTSNIPIQNNVKNYQTFNDEYLKYIPKEKEMKNEKRPEYMFDDTPIHENNTLDNNQGAYVNQQLRQSKIQEQVVRYR